MSSSRRRTHRLLQYVSSGSRKNNPDPLKTQEEVFEEAMEDPLSIGNLAVTNNIITQEDLTEAVNVQRKRLRIGQILIDMGKLSEPQLEELLLEQKIKRGEIDDSEAIIQFEQSRRRKRLKAMQKSFAEAGTQAKEFTESVLGLTAKVNEE